MKDNKQFVITLQSISTSLLYISVNRRHYSVKFYSVIILGYEIRYTTSEFLKHGEEKEQQEQEEKQEEAEEQEQEEKVRRFSYKRRIQSPLISNKKCFFL